MESDIAEDRESIHNIVDQREAINTINHYKEIVKMGNKKQ